jgi:hypothetical protein
MNGVVFICFRLLILGCTRELCSTLNFPEQNKTSSTTSENESLQQDLIYLQVQSTEILQTTFPYTFSILSLEVSYCKFREHDLSIMRPPTQLEHHSRASSGSLRYEAIFSFERGLQE